MPLEEYGGGFALGKMAGIAHAAPLVLLSHAATGGGGGTGLQQGPRPKRHGALLRPGGGDTFMDGDSVGDGVGNGYRGSVGDGIGDVVRDGVGVGVGDGVGDRAGNSDLSAHCRCCSWV